MFLTHFKLTSQPFAERIAAEALWQDDRMRQGVARLRYLAEQATVGLLTGASGVGKSAVLKRFVHELPRPQHQPVYLHLTRLPSSALLKLVVTQLGEVPRRGKERLFEQILETIPAPESILPDKLQVLVTTLDYNDYVGRIAIGRIFSGNVAVGQNVSVCKLDGSIEKTRITKLFTFEGLKQQPVNEASAGESIALAGI